MAFSSFEGSDFSFRAATRDQGPLGAQLAAWHDRATRLGRVPCVYLTASWCPPSVKLEQSLGDPRMQRAFSRVEAITFDIDVWGDELTAAGFAAHSVPIFFVLGPDARPVGPHITGAAWGENTPDNMAPPLTSFFDQARASLAGAPATLPSPTPPSAAATAAQPPRWHAIAQVVGGLLLLVLAVSLKVYLGEKRSRERASAAQSERIRQDVQRSIQQNMEKARNKPAPTR